MPWLIGARRVYSQKEFLKLLERECKQSGGQSAFARFAGVSRQHVTNVLAGRRLPGHEILEAMNMGQDLMFFEKKPPNKNTNARRA
jgi:transcriptional regulator with XRE-family HTH domain